tara:strand:+ start:317 stop:652 length:336 start_codon:yes stop_codon:yes gene_type:complete
MKRIEKHIDIGEELDICTDYSYGDKPYSIKLLRTSLQELEAKGATHVKITGEVCDGDIDSIDIQAIKIETESDEEYNARLFELERKKLRQEGILKAQRLKIYEKMKIEFGD